MSNGPKFCERCGKLGAYYNSGGSDLLCKECHKEKGESAEAIVTLFFLILTGLFWKLPRYFYVGGAEKNGSKKDGIQSAAIYYASMLICVPLMIYFFSGSLNVSMWVLIILASLMLIALIAWGLIGSPEVEGVEGQEEGNILGGLFIIGVIAIAVSYFGFVKESSFYKEAKAEATQAEAEKQAKQEAEAAQAAAEKQAKQETVAKEAKKEEERLSKIRVILAEPLKDSRNGINYKTVKIGTQTWMAENLNIETGKSKCYDDYPARCEKYGRLYDWETAMKACPSGWHLPSSAEWDKLFRYVDGTSGTESHYESKTAGKYLKLKDTYATDNYGFSALSGGYGSSSGSFAEEYGNGYWWSASENDADNAYYVYTYRYDKAGSDSSDKTYLYSVRCVQD